MKEFLDRIEQTLTIPAAEYVPAIGDVFAIIDEARKAIDSQQPVAEVVAGTENFGAVQFSGPIPPKGTKLYTVPPALQEPSEQLREDVKRAREKIGLLYADGVPDFMDRIFVAALQEVPREPIATFRYEVQPDGETTYDVWLSDGMFGIKTPGDYPLYASPSTTQQQPSVAAHALNTTPVVDHATQQQEAGSVPAEVIAWRDAYAEYIAASDAYNARLTAIREREAAHQSEFGRDNPQAEWKAIDKAHGKWHALLRPMFDALAAAPSTPAREEAGVHAVDPAFRHAPHCGARLVTAGECTCGLPAVDSQTNPPADADGGGTCR